MKTAIAAVFLAAAVPGAAQVCNPRNFAGAYGFQLSGRTMISGSSKPVASMGRLDFDGYGAVSGTSSVNFDGFLLGNPVTGKYEVRNDCTIVWSLQDDSGAFQHFAGTVTANLDRASFRQTDPGGARNGSLVKLARECSAAAMQGNYQFSVSGSTRSMIDGQDAGKVSLEGLISVDPAGNLAMLRDGAAINAGTLTVDSDCIVNIDLIPSPGAHMKLRGVLVGGGKEILAIESDPGAAVNASFRAK